MCNRNVGIGVLVWYKYIKCQIVYKLQTTCFKRCNYFVHARMLNLILSEYPNYGCICVKVTACVPPVVCGLVPKILLRYLPQASLRRVFKA